MRSRTDAVGEVGEAGQDRGQGRGVRRWGFSLGSPVASLLVLHPTVPRFTATASPSPPCHLSTIYPTLPGPSPSLPPSFHPTRPSNPSLNPLPSPSLSYAHLHTNHQSM